MTRRRNEQPRAVRRVPRALAEGAAAELGATTVHDAARLAVLRATPEQLARAAEVGTAGMTRLHPGGVAWAQIDAALAEHGCIKADAQARALAWLLSQFCSKTS